MNPILNKILCNPNNTKILKFLGINPNAQNELTAFKDKTYYTHEGLEDFLKLDLPIETKYILNTSGVIINPSSGEILAFQFGRSDFALQVISWTKYNKRYSHIKLGLLRNFKICQSFNVSIGYFSNIYGDGETIVDIRQLGKNWGLATYFRNDAAKRIQEVYQLKNQVKNQ